MPADSIHILLTSIIRDSLTLVNSTAVILPLKNPNAFPLGLVFIQRNIPVFQLAKGMRIPCLCFVLYW